MGDFTEIVERLPKEIKVLKNVTLSGRWYPFLLLQSDIGILAVKPIQFTDWLFFTDITYSAGKVFWQSEGFYYQMTHPASILREQCCYLSYWLQSSETRWFKKNIPFNTQPPIRGLFFMEGMMGDGDIPSDITKTFYPDFSLSRKMDWWRLLDEGKSSLISFIVDLSPAVQGSQEISPEYMIRWYGKLAEKASDADQQAVSGVHKEDEDKISRQGFKFDSLSLNGFKVYGEEQTLSFSPITILLGENNSGKSTIIQSLLLLKQSLENPKKSVPLRFHEPYWDLGTFENCWHRNGNDSEKCIKFKLAFKNPLGQKRSFGFQFERIQTEQLALKKLTYYENPIAGEEGNLEHPLYTFLWDDETKMLQLKKIGFEHPLWVSKNSELIRQKKSWWGALDLKKLLTEEGPTQAILELRNFLPTKVKTFDFDYSDDPRYSLIYSTLFKEVEELSRTMDNFFNNIIYIGPNRPSIKRFYSGNNLFTEEDKRNWDMFYYDLANLEIRMKVNKWLSNFQINYEIKILKGPRFGTDIVLPRLKAKNSNEKDTDSDKKHEDSDEKDTAPDKKDKHTEELSLDSDDGSLLAFCDVGQGLTHLFPIIVTLLGKKNSFIIIEEPEVHIHPALQTCLGDLFIESAQMNHNIILVESHSEYILDRLQRRIAEEKISCDEVNLYYLKIEQEKISDNSSNHQDGTPVFTKLQLDEYGLFKNKIPPEFFNIGLTDSKFQIERMLKRKQKQKASYD